VGIHSSNGKIEHLSRPPAWQNLPAGSAFYEPADANIANFGNASDSEPMTFVAFYLLDGEQELIRMLN
jgi:hypothetical protein